MAKILLVDDDEKLCEMIAEWLRKEGYIVEVCYDGRDALDRLAISSFDLLIVDWHLPHASGIEVCKTYRQAKGTAPILMLTNQNAVQRRIEGLDSGADDYLTKPFDIQELSARLRALLRRPQALQDSVLRCRGLELDTNARQLRKNGKPVELYPREMAILEFLMKNQNHVFTLEAVQQRVWPSDSETSTESLRVNIARLRSKIETEGEKPILKTVHRQGYMLDSTSEN